MRRSIVGLVGAGVLLAGCGAATSSAPLESASGSGSVASMIRDCPPGPPAPEFFDYLNDFHVPGVSDDGAVGRLINSTGSGIYVRSIRRGGVCLLNPGDSVAYKTTGAHVQQLIDANVNFPQWMPISQSESRVNADFRNTSFVLHVSQYAVGGNGIAIGITDPYVGRPWVTTVFMRSWPPGEAKCGSATGALDTGGLDEGQSYVLKGPAPGEVKVTRFADDKKVVYEFVGNEDSKVDDWARIDVEVIALGTC